MTRTLMKICRTLLLPLLAFCVPLCQVGHATTKNLVFNNGELVKVLNKAVAEGLGEAFFRYGFFFAYSAKVGGKKFEFKAVRKVKVSDLQRDQVEYIKYRLTMAVLEKMAGHPLNPIDYPASIDSWEGLKRKNFGKAPNFHLLRADQEFIAKVFGNLYRDLHDARSPEGHYSEDERNALYQRIFDLGKEAVHSIGVKEGGDNKGKLTDLVLTWAQEWDDLQQRLKNT